MLLRKLAELESYCIYVNSKEVSAKMQKINVGGMCDTTY